MPQISNYPFKYNEALIEENLKNGSHFLGKICGRVHEYKQTGQSVRRTKDRACVICCKLAKTSVGISSFPTAESDLELDLKKMDAKMRAGEYYLGPPCRRGHFHRDTGQTMRTTKGKRCVMCDRARWRSDLPSVSVEAEQDRRDQERLDSGWYWLGRLCVRGHDYKDSDQSLWSKHGCVQCARESRLVRQKKITKKKRTKPNRKYYIEEQLFKGNYVLGPPCMHGHLYKNTGKTVRRATSEMCCVECQHIKSARRWRESKEGRKNYSSSTVVKT